MDTSARNKARQAPQGVREPSQVLDSGDTYSEGYRLQCEARSVLRLPFDKRKQHLADIERIRGKKAREYLEQAIWVEFRKGQDCSSDARQKD